TPIREFDVICISSIIKLYRHPLGVDIEHNCLHSLMPGSPVIIRDPRALFDTVLNPQLHTAFHSNMMRDRSRMFKHLFLPLFSSFPPPRLRRLASARLQFLPRKLSRPSFSALQPSHLPRATAAAFFFACTWPEAFHKHGLLSYNKLFFTSQPG